MSSEFSTDLIFRGKPDELFAFMNVLRFFATDRLERYREKHDCSYISDLGITMTDEAINRIIQECNGEITEGGIDGPWGAFDDLINVGLFEALADAAPSGSFEGKIDGNFYGVPRKLYGRLIGGKLHLAELYYSKDDVFDFDYIYDPIMKQLIKEEDFEFWDELEDEWLEELDIEDLDDDEEGCSEDVGEEGDD